MGYLVKDCRFLSFALALIFYGAFGSPTPDNPNLVEVLIFLCLSIALLPVVVGYSIIKISFNHTVQRWQLAGGLLLMFGFFVPTLVALYQGNTLFIIIRDIIGFAFLGIPLLVVPYLKQGSERNNIFLYLVLFIGLAFSVRVLFLDFSFFSQKEELLYLANSPLVLFSALFLSAVIFLKSQHIFVLKNAGLILLFLCLLIIPLSAMYIDFQRASFLALGLMVVGLIGWGLIKEPLNMIKPIVIALIIGSVFDTQIFGVIENIAVKTSQVGLNMRYQEMIAVWETLNGSGLSLLFGQGWGAEFASPAVGNLNVSYTHSLMSYMFLKTGLTGLGLTLIYLVFVFEKLVRLVFIKSMKERGFPLAIALFWPFVIPVFFYASYKSLDYGLLLSLILMVENKKESSSLEYE